MRILIFSANFLCNVYFKVKVYEILSQIYEHLHISIRHSCQTLTELGLSNGCSKSPQISNLLKIRPVGAELFHVDRQTDRYDKANSRFSQS
jgi:hypothetical protein